MADAYSLIQMISYLSAVVPLTPWETCAVHLINRNKPSTVYFFCTPSSCPSNEFYKRMYIPTQTLLETQTENLPRFGKFDLVFLVSNEEDIAWSNETIQGYRLGGKNDFKLVVIANSSENPNDIAHMGLFFRAMWKSGILYSAVLLKKDTSAEIFTYIPFRSSESCEDTSPVSLGECAKVVEQVFNPSLKVQNLHNCSIRVTMRDDTPFISYPLVGRYKDMIQEMGYRMNFRVVSVESIDSRRGGSCGAEESQGVRGEVIAGRAHMAIGQYNKKECSQLEYIGLPLMQCMSWCTPIIPGRANVLDFLVGQFHSDVWIAITTTIFILVISVGLLCFLSQEPYSGSSAMNLALVIFAQVPRIGFRADSPRIVLGVWLFASVVIRAAYESDSKSRSTAPIRPYVMRGLKDLADMKLRLCSNPTNIGLLKNSDQPLVQWIYNNTEMCRISMFALIEQAAREQNLAIFTNDLRCSVTSSFLSKTTEPLYSYTGGCFKMFQVTPLITLPGLPFNEIWEDLLQRFTEAGLLQKWLDIQDFRRSDGRLQRYSLEHLLPSLFFLAFGCAIGFIAFLIENATSRLRCLAIKSYTIAPTRVNI